MKNYSIIMLQETHSTKNWEKRWEIKSGNKIYFSHGTTNVRGVAILFNREMNVTVHNVISDCDGCYLILYITWQDKKIVLANIYALNIDSPSFFKKVFKEIESFTPNYFIIGGDFNLALSKIDCQGTHINNDKSAEWLNEHIKNNGYIDLWRYTYEDKAGFTWH